MMQILYVEDAPADREMMRRLIHVANHQGTFASNLEEARSALHSPPDLILVDIILGHARIGDRFVQELRASGFQGPIVAVTALALPSEVERWYDVGFTEVVTKPFEATALLDLFDRYMQ